MRVGPANPRDEQWLQYLLCWLWAVLSYGGRRRPAALQGDPGYGVPWPIALVLARAIRSLLAVRGAAHGFSAAVPDEAGELQLAGRQADRRPRPGT